MDDLELALRRGETVHQSIHWKPADVNVAMLALQIATWHERCQRMLRCAAQHRPNAPVRVESYELPDGALYVVLHIGDDA